MRDFEQDRRTIQDRKDGYVTNEVFLKYADEGWPAALAEIESLKRQLEMAAEMATFNGCPLEASIEKPKFCVAQNSFVHCKQDESECWKKYFQQKANSNDNGGNSKDKAANSKDSGTFQNGNNHGTTSKTETVGEGKGEKA